MATKRRKKKREPFFDDLSPQTKQAIVAILFAVLGIFFVLSSLGYAGVAGSFTHKALTYLFGVAFILAPSACALYVYVLLKPREDEKVSVSKIIGVALLLLSSLGLIALYKEGAGGLGGLAVSKPLLLLFGGAAAAVALTAVVLIGFFLTFNTGIKIPRLFRKKEALEEDGGDLEDEEEEYEDEELEEDYEDSEESKEDKTSKKSLREKIGLGKQEFAVSSFSGPYAIPPLSLLEKDRGKARSGDVKANANIIKRTLQNFNINVEMDEISIGPSVTRYSLKPAEGVRISKIMGLQNNLELALAAHPVRIEAPIPGKSLVGIEVPNTTKATPGMASLLSSPEYTDSPKPLLVALGKDIAGVTHFANLAKMPHVLIAGTTGSGKSVLIHSLVISLLFRNSPEQLRFIMVDPKRVELTVYNGIPHLLTPVITDAKKTILSLKWAIKEMERRYEILEEKKARDISSYHETIYKPALKEHDKDNGGEEDPLPEPLPYIVIIIDELADIMFAYPRELEASIVRLAQMSRAVGMHLILATQRPEVKVITGLIKANMPCRIALKVNSQIDSRTILDTVGADKLLGQGDALFLSGDLAKPLRLQSAYISESELKKVTSYLKKQTEVQSLDSIDLNSNEEDSSTALFDSVDENDDELYEDAKETVIDAGKASTSYLQRKLRIGYSRAARLMDMLEDNGVIGPQDGSRPREILAESDDENEEEDEE